MTDAGAHPRWVPTPKMFVVLKTRVMRSRVSEKRRASAAARACFETTKNSKRSQKIDNAVFDIAFCFFMFRTKNYCVRSTVAAYPHEHVRLRLHDIVWSLHNIRARWRVLLFGKMRRSVRCSCVDCPIRSTDARDS